jgi:hypothetical protein
MAMLGSSSLIGSILDTLSELTLADLPAVIWATECRG